MNREVSFLEELLFNSMFHEIEQRYEEVIELYKNDYEIMGIAKHLKGMSDSILGIFRDIPNPYKKLTEEHYTTLYEALKDISMILYDLSIADGEQLNYVIVQAYRKLDNINSLFEKLV